MRTHRDEGSARSPWAMEFPGLPGLHSRLCKVAMVFPGEHTCTLTAVQGLLLHTFLFELLLNFYLGAEINIKKQPKLAGPAK